MKKCKECQGFYQGHSCDCGYGETKKKQYSPQDEWLHKRREEINGWKAQINTMLGIIESSPNEIIRKHAINLLAYAEQSLREAKAKCGDKLKEVLKVPAHLQCKGFDPEHGNCSKIGTLSHLGSELWFCQFHYEP
jgi:hypothetical protein